MHAATENPISPLLLSDRLITMAEQAGQAGYRDAAHRLLALACQVLNNPPLPPRPPFGARRKNRPAH